MKTLSSELVNNSFSLYLAVSFLIVALYWVYKMYFSRKWILENQKISGDTKFKEIFYLIIPVLNEEKIIKDTSNYFLGLLSKYKNSKLIFVTTSKETEKTVELAKNISSKNRKVLHFKYFGKGVMAHQLNYAISEIRKFDTGNNFIAVYNADSRPHKDTFDYVFSSNNLKNRNVFQQYGNYTSNLNTFPNSFFKNSILTASSGWQNRWSLGIEFFRSLKNLNNFGILKPLSYCIGHGMFIRLSILDKVEGFSEKTHNEDLVMGYVLNNIGEEIYPIPFFDYSESPNLISSLFFQKANWFFGPGQFYDYYKLVKENDFYTNKLMLFSYTIKVMNLAVVWIMGPTLLFILLLLSFYSIYFFVLFVVVYILFLVIPNYLGIVLVNRLDNRRTDNKLLLLSKLFIGSIFTYFLHGLSGYIGLFRYIKSKITKSRIKKGKTFMSR